MDASAPRRGAVCAGVDWHPRQYWAQQESYRATVDHVVAKLNLPALTAVHLARKYRAPAAFNLQAGNR